MAATEKSNDLGGLEKSLEELEALVVRLESGDLPLEQALKEFEHGVKLTRQCQAALQEAEQKVEILLKKTATAEPSPFTNGDEGQRNIIDTVPGRSDYTPLWAVRMVTWKEDADVRVLRSAAAVARAQRAGDVTIRPMPIVVNCPVL